MTPNPTNDLTTTNNTEEREDNNNSNQNKKNNQPDISKCESQEWLSNQRSVLAKNTELPDERRTERGSAFSSGISNGHIRGKIFTISESIVLDKGSEKGK